jgi:hypothetical protein
MVRNNHGGKSGKKKKGKPQCFNCKEWCHIRKNCPTYNKADGAANIDVNSAADLDYEVMALEREFFNGATRSSSKLAGLISLSPTTSRSSTSSYSRSLAQRSTG